jgi:arabinose-5-phosphate isomerase
MQRKLSTGFRQGTGRWSAKRIVVTPKTIDETELLPLAREVLRQEARALEAMGERLDEQFTRAVELILACAGRVVATGMGKSGAVARKIAGTLASTGTPALFLHPAEGVHGDLGMVAMGDVLLALSNSGDTEELNAILPAVARIEVPIIALTGRADSPLGRAAAARLDTAVEREVCPFNLAPTASTTAQMAMGDALAIAVMRRREFSSADYARLHPRGALGRRLLLTVGDVMRTGDAVARVSPDRSLLETMFAITKAHSGAAIVEDANGKMLGLICDGDIRRRLVEDADALHKPCGPRVNAQPKTVTPDRLAAETLQTMQTVQISEMPVLDPAGHVVGMLNLKDLLKAGIL